MEGFIPGSRASLMLDIVAVAMIVIVPAVIAAVMQAKVNRNYATHKKMMQTVCIILLIAVVLFELEMRLIGWQDLARQSPYFESSLFPVLGVHLCFAISGTVTLFLTIILALKQFPQTPRPNAHSKLHKKLGPLAVGLLIGTSITGWIFYWMAFVASV